MKKFLAALVTALGMATALPAAAFPTSSGSDSYTGIFFDNVEYCIGCGDGTVDVGDTFVLMFRAQSILDSNSITGQTGTTIWTQGGVLGAPVEITGYSVISVVGIIEDFAGPGLDLIVFGAGTDPNSILAAGVSLAIFEDTNLDFNSTNQGTALTTSTDGTLHSEWSLVYSYIIASADIPTTGPIGTAYGGFNEVSSPFADLGLLDDPNEVLANLLVQLFFSTEAFRIAGADLSCVGPTCLNHFGSNDPAVLQPIPEPSTLALLALALLGLVPALRRRRRS